MLFAEGKPLGKRGIRWLKIHLATLYGYDKATFDDRETYTTEHLEDVYDSAENPLTVRPARLDSLHLTLLLGTSMVVESR